MERTSGVEDRHDLMRPRVDDDDLVADEEVVISTPTRIEKHDLFRHRIEMNRAGNPAADGNREVDVRHRLHVVLLDGGAHRCVLFGRELYRSASRALIRGPNLGIAGLFRAPHVRLVLRVGLHFRARLAGRLRLGADAVWLHIGLGSVLRVLGLATLMLRFVLGLARLHAGIRRFVLGCSLGFMARFLGRCGLLRGGRGRRLCRSSANANASARDQCGGGDGHQQCILSIHHGKPSFVYRSNTDRATNAGGAAKFREFGAKALRNNEN